MTVSELNHRTPTPTRAEIATVQQLTSQADQIRYACEHMPPPLTTERLRGWLSERGVTINRREHASRVMNHWKSTHQQPVTVPEPSAAGVTVLPSPRDVPAPGDGAPERTRAVTPQLTPALVKRARILRAGSYVVLAVVAAAGAALSYESLCTAAVDVFPPVLAQMFPLLVDALIVGASLAYLAGATVGRGRPGWRMTAHAGVGGTLLLNALAADTARDVPWHIAAPLVWSVIVELTGRDLLGDHRQQHARPDSIPVALWLTAPGESFSTWLRVRRQAAHATARLDVGTHAAAREALRMALPGSDARRVRRVVARQLRAGSITPERVLAQATSILADLKPGTPKAVLRDVLTAAVPNDPHPPQS